MAEKTPSDRQPNLPNPEEQERLLERFIGSFEKYQAWIEEHIAFSERELQEALKKPPGVRHISNLYRSRDDGTFWKMSTGDYEGKRQGVLIEYVRPAGDRFGKYQAVLFPYRSMDDVRNMEKTSRLYDDWAWEEIDDEERQRGVRDTVATSRVDLDRNRFAQTVIRELLRQKDHIRQWLKEYALESDRLTYSEADDLDEFYGRFLPALQSCRDESGKRVASHRQELPDPSPFHSMLHLTLNALAGHPNSREYLY